MLLSWRLIDGFVVDRFTDADLDRRRGQPQRDQRGFLSTVQTLRRPGGRVPLPPVEDQLETFHHEALAQVLDGALPAAVGVCDLLVALVRRVRIDLRQNARPACFLHGSVSLAVARQLGPLGPRLETRCT